MDDSNRNRKTVKCARCKTRNYVIKDLVETNELGQRSIICERCNKPIVLKKL